MRPAAEVVGSVLAATDAPDERTLAIGREVIKALEDEGYRLFRPATLAEELADDEVSWS